MDRSSMVWVMPDGIAVYKAPDTLPSDFGAKARGLMWVPEEWVPAFFVIAPAVFAGYKALARDSRLKYLQELQVSLAKALRIAGIGGDLPLILRSNAVKETIRERGRYASVDSQSHRMPEDLDSLYSLTLAKHPDTELGVIVQQSIAAIVKGHLSNERRAAEEYRDGLVEFEETNGDIRERRISHRRWRQGRPASQGALVCNSRSEVLNSLRAPLALSAQRRKRAHFEWVWDGKFVHFVQADVIDERPAGTTPPSTVRPQRADSTTPEELQCFALVELQPERCAGKLHNHALYAQRGCWQPPFYQLADKQILSAIVKRLPSADLDNDLRVLTARPLVIRTSTGAQGMPLLPRSHQLTDVDQAKKWLYGDFASEIAERGIDVASISLVAHHYIPALAAAFSMGSGDGLEVYIESLWGIPEGLYYYPFDAYLVHTIGTDPSSMGPREYEQFGISKRVRYKSHFVAPNDQGIFVRHETAPPWDWKPTISDVQILAKIAAFTRVTARAEGYPVNLMWFLYCETGAQVIDAMPWYHERVPGQTEGTEFRRNSRDSNVTVATESDLLSLERRVEAREAGRPSERLVVHLSPTEDQAIRSEDFARRVGEAARQLDAIVLLNGATLSHIYYVLCRTGAHVAVRNASDIATRRGIHKKLVRDKVPEAVASTGEVARIATLTREETIAALRLKLVEEAFEVRDAEKEQVADELADVIEVVRALASTTGIGLAAIERLRKKKAERRGAFKSGVVLLDTGAKEPKLESPSLLDESESPEQGVLRAPAPPVLEPRIHTGPADVRDTAEFVEHVQTASVALTYPEWTLESPASAMLPEGFAADHISWSIDGQRKGTTLRLRVKIRVGSKQLELPLEFPASDVGDDTTSELI